ncbi:unnamed protein product [Rhizophagus irregularis]|nr:unnamed protein product [Rhizophagus irregularis]
MIYNKRDLLLACLDQIKKIELVIDVPKPVRPKSPERQPPLRPRSLSPAPAPIVHTRGRDRRMEKPKAIPPTPVPKSESQMVTPSEVEQQDAHDRHARKSGEHLRTWGARLRRRWNEVTGEECDLPKTLKECQRLHHDLLQADDESFENNQIDPEAGPESTTQAHALAPPAREGLAPIPQGEVEDIHFKECPVGRDLERPHENRSLMSKWVGDIPYGESTNNPAYGFNKQAGLGEYKAMPYMPQLMA